jgi:hypothetical protein
MAMAEDKRKGGGGKLSRSETVTVRLDPKLRYLAELAARKHRRTLSSFIEWAVEESLANVSLREASGDSEEEYMPAISVGSAHNSLWDVDEADRFVKLATQFPELLTHEEQVVWKLVRENGAMWKGKFNQRREWVWRVEREQIYWERLREYWGAFKAVADGKADRETLPQWEKTGEPEDTGDNPFNVS